MGPQAIRGHLEIEGASLTGSLSSLDGNRLRFDLRSKSR